MELFIEGSTCPSLIIDGTREELVQAAHDLRMRGRISQETWQSVNDKLKPAVKFTAKLKAAWESGMLNASGISEAVALLDECQSQLADWYSGFGENAPRGPEVATLLAKLKGEES